jgi:glycosyltransferase involved in cell wall biosynthesis
MELERFHIDIALQNSDIKNKKLLELCKQKKCKIYITTPFEKNYIKSIRELNEILKNGQYNVLHFHANSLINMVPVLCAYRNGINLVIHSHNSNNNLGSIFGKTLHYVNRWIISHCDMQRVACSPEAGRWMFGKKQFEILNNAIALNEYQFNPEFRKEIRSIYSLTEKQIVVGHVGRFVAAKNHRFLIECFEKISMSVPEAVLMLVGNGELFEAVKTLADEKALSDKVIFVGEVQDTKKYYSAFDVMVFPSYFEGLPFTLVEAQAAGIPVIASDHITRDVDVTGLIEYHSLNEGIDIWAKSTLDIQKKDLDRSQSNIDMQGSVFDINELITKITKIYDAEKKLIESEQ